MKTELRYLLHDPDARGNDRYYVRLKVGDRFRKKRIRASFRGAGGDITPEFMAEYWAALAELRGEATSAPATERVPREDTFSWLFDRYYRSPTFKAFDPATQRDKRSVFDRFAETAGELPFRKYRREDMERSQLARAATPGAADKLVKYMRSLFNWAMAQKPPLASANPANGVANIHKTIDGFHTWTEEEIDQFRAYWPLGSVPRLAMEVMINVGARRSDAARVGPQNEFRHEGERWIRFTAYKGRKRYPTVIEARLSEQMIAAVEAVAGGGKAYVLSPRGTPYTIESFGNAFSKWCTEAGLPQCSCHGLRKAAAVAYAESNSSAVELMAVFGWTNLKTAQGYIEKANKRRLRANAFERRIQYQNSRSVPLSREAIPHETIKEKSDGKTKTK